MLTKYLKIKKVMVKQHVLYLTLKKKWFDMIASGEKKEEYRELKMYWADRFMTGFPSTYGYIERLNPDFKHFDIIQFRNGYAKDSPTVCIKCSGFRIGKGRPEWGAEPDKEYFVILLGNVLNSEQSVQGSDTTKSETTSKS